MRLRTAHTVACSSAFTAQTWQTLWEAADASTATYFTILSGVFNQIAIVLCALVCVALTTDSRHTRDASYRPATQ